MAWALFAERLAPPPDAISPGDQPPPGLTLQQRRKWAEAFVNAQRIQEVLYPED
jgi:hypothetical protein